MNENEALERMKAAISDESPLDLHIRVMDAWMIVSALQLAVLHPGMSQRQKDWLTQIARQFQQVIEDRHPDAAEVLEMGWHREHDVRVQAVQRRLSRKTRRG